MKYLLLVLSALLLCSCATQRHAPRFDVPSTAPIKQHAQTIELKIDAADSHADKAKIAITTASKIALELKTTSDLDALTKQLAGSLKIADSEIDALKSELLSAKTESALLRAATQQLDVQVKDETAKANAVATQNDSLTTENASLKTSLKGMNKWWGIGAVIYGFKRLAEHLLILLAVVIGIGVAVMVLSFFFPVIGVAAQAVMPILRGIGERIGSIFSRRKA